METILETNDINNIGNVRPSAGVIPAGNPVDIEIQVSIWFLIATGSTLYHVAYNQGWDLSLTSAGLQIDSIDAPWNSTTIVYHCTALYDVNVSSLVLDDAEQRRIMQAGGGQILTYVILGVITVLGIVGGVTYMKVSADLTASTIAKAELTERLIDSGYTAQQISDILKGVSTEPVNPLPALGLPVWAPWAIAGAAALIVLIPGKK